MRSLRTAPDNTRTVRHIEDLFSHLRTSNTRYRATVPADFLDRNQPPMFITLYFIVTRLPGSLRSVRDHFLSLDPTSLTVDLLEQHLLAAETSAVSGGRGGGGGSGGGGGGSSGGSGGSGGGGSSGIGGGSGGFGGGSGASGGSGGSGSGGSGGGAEPGRAEPGGAEPAGVEPGGAEPEGVEPGGADFEGAESGGAEPRGTTSSGGPTARDSAVGDTGAGGAGVIAGAGGTGGTAAAGPGGARRRGTGAAGTGGVGGAGAGDPTEPGAAGAGGAGEVGAGAKGSSTGGADAGGAGAVDPEAGGAGGTVSRSRRYSQPPHCLLLLLTLSRPAVLQSVMSLSLVLPPLFALVVAFLVRVPLLSPAHTLWHFVLPLFHYVFLCHLLLSPLFLPSLTVSLTALVLLDELCLATAVPHFASMLLAREGDLDAPDIPTPRSYVEAIMGPYSSQWQAAMDAKMASGKSTGTYVDTVPPSRANIVDGMWIFRRDYELHSMDFSTAFLQGSLHEKIRLRRPPGFTGSFPAGTQWSLCRPVYDLRQAPHEWHNTLRTTLAAMGFTPTADPSLFLRTDTSLPAFYILVYPTPLSTGYSLSAPPSDESVEPSGLYPELVGCLMYLMTCTRRDLVYPLSLLACYVAPVGTSGMGLVLGGRGPVVLTSHADASWVDDSAAQRSSHGYTFSLGSGSVSWQSTRSSSVLSLHCEVEIYAGAMAAQELRWLTYLLTDLGEQPRSPPVLYVDNEAMNALCQEHRLEHRTKSIAPRYFLARELQQRGQLRLAYVVTRTSTADIFTKALLPGDHQRFSTVLGLVPTLPHLLTA
ncbi:unnamed protein product [Closterium sp. NIES-53]